jgi:outer membrane protein OmpA-like peptidoglycan-associated protein
MTVICVAGLLVLGLGCATVKHDLESRRVIFKLWEDATEENELVYDTYVKEHAPSEDAFVAVQRIAARHLRAKRWDKATEVFDSYAGLFPGMGDRFATIHDLLTAESDESTEIKNLGPEINTSASEFWPVPTADGGELYFTGSGRSDGLGGEDIYRSVSASTGWHQAGPMGHDVNSPSHNESTDAISADGNKLIMFSTHEDPSGSIYYRYRTASGCSETQTYPAPINLEGSFDAGGFETSDGKAILFASQRSSCIGEYHEKGELFHGSGWGNIDIFVCLKTLDGWSEAINLGPTINTPYCDYSPFLHPDGKTLYFSSDGHAGLGRLDLYKSTRLREDSWTDWSTPVNLGKQINTAGEDWGYKIATAGDVAYFSANDREGGYGGNDIYSITLPAEARPEVVATIRGTVTNDDGEQLEAEIIWENLTSGETVGELRSDPRDGSYFVALPMGKKYGYYASAEGYYPISRSIDLVGQTEAVDTTVDIVLKSLEQMKETGESVRINNIFFEFDKYDLLPESYPELNRLANILKDLPDTRVEIAGHTDSIDSDSYNMELSRKRAGAVVDYLVSVGCSQSQLLAKGYGESRPIATNDTEEGRAQNRRVEFSFIK